MWRCDGKSLAAMTLLLLAVPPAGMTQAVDADPVREIDTLALQWTSLAHQKDRLEANWREQKPVLEQQLSLLDRETRELNDFLAASAEQQDEVEQKRLELLEEQTRLEGEQSVLERALVQAGIKLRALHPQLPPPLFAAWAEDLPRFDDTILTASEKLQLVTELMGQIDDFERKVTLNEAVMTLADGREHLVKQVYLGLSHGWYVTDDQRFAAAGTTGPDGWQWTAVDEAQEIAAIIGILERRLDPELVAIGLRLNAQQSPGAQ